MPNDYWDKVATLFNKCNFNVYKGYKKIEITRELIIKTTIPA